MPNWKKLITSGSSGSLAYLNVDTSIDASSFTGSLSYSNLTGVPTLISGSSQLNNTTIDGLTILNPTISGSEIALNLPNSSTSAVVISSGLASDFDMRLGTTATNQYAWSTNLSYNGSNWVKDDATRSAWRMNQVVLTTDAASGMEFNYAPPNSTSLETLMTLRKTILDINVPLDVSGRIVSSGGITGSLLSTNGVLSSSAQIASDISGSFVQASSSIASDIDALQSDSSSFSTRVTDLETLYKTLITGVTSSVITHNLQEEFPIVQLYESASKEVFIPQTIKSVDQDNTQIILSELIDCYVVIKR